MITPTTMQLSASQPVIERGIDLLSSGNKYSGLPFVRIGETVITDRTVTLSYQLVQIEENETRATPLIALSTCDYTFDRQTMTYALGLRGIMEIVGTSSIILNNSGIVDLGPFLDSFNPDCIDPCLRAARETAYPLERISKNGFNGVSGTNMVINASGFGLADIINIESGSEPGKVNVQAVITGSIDINCNNTVYDYQYECCVDVDDVDDQIDVDLVVSFSVDLDNKTIEYKGVEDDDSKLTSESDDNSDFSAEELLDDTGLLRTFYMQDDVVNELVRVARIKSENKAMSVSDLMALRYRYFQDQSGSGYPPEGFMILLSDPREISQFSLPVDPRCTAIADAATVARHALATSNALDSTLSTP